MTDIVRRIRDRPNDAPMPTERLLDDAVIEIERLRSIIAQIADVLLKAANFTRG